MDQKTIELAIEKAAEYIAAHPLPADVVSVPLDQKLVAEHIDHTLLKPDATPAQITVLCEEARRHCFKVNTLRSQLHKSAVDIRPELLCKFVSHPTRCISPVRVLVNSMCRGRLPTRRMHHFHQSIRNNRSHKSRRKGDRHGHKRRSP